MSALLSVRGLNVAYGGVEIAREVGFELDAGEAFGIVGESGSGKTQTMLAVLRLLGRGGRVTAGSVLFEGRDLLTLPEKAMRRVRGRGIALVSQDALTALNPVMTIGAQMAEPLIYNESMSENAALARCAELLDQVGIAGAKARLGAYPHQLSGGMRQRVVIAMAISQRPKILVADEPTTALDVTVQAQIVQLIDRLRRELDMALVLISHDLGVVAGVADRVAIMYAGRIVETAPAATLFARPTHPYARALLAAKPRLDRSADTALQPIGGLPPDPARPPEGCAFNPRCTYRIARCVETMPPLEAVGEGGHLAACWRASDVLPPVDSGSTERARRPSDAPEQIRVESLTVRYPVRSKILRRVTGEIHAVDGVSLALRKGETVALVGESGSGKTTTGRAMLGLAPCTAGTVSYFGRDLAAIQREGVLSRLGQMVFQDPYGSLNARMTVGAALAEVIAVHRLGSRVEDLLDSVGLRPEIARRYPSQLSGGQRQRVVIARALAIEPQFLVCDEVVSALDVSVQGQIINLLMELQRTHGLTYLFISHDLAVVRHIAHHVVVMYGGKVMEEAPCEQLFASARHPYTHALLASVPVADPVVERARKPVDLRGGPPDAANPPPGCRVHLSCRHATERCRVEEPALVRDGKSAIACHHWKAIEKEYQHARA